MGLIPTLIALAAAIALAAFARYKANQPYEPGAPRFVNWTLVMILAGAIAVILVAHLFGVFGIETGRGRGGYLR